MIAANADACWMNQISSQRPTSCHLALRACLAHGPPAICKPQHLNRAGLTQVLWWCITVLYLVELRHCCKLPPGPLGAAIASLMQYRLDRDDIYFGVQVLLWQASRYLQLSKCPAVSRSLDSLICQHAKDLVRPPSHNQHMSPDPLKAVQPASCRALTSQADICCLQTSLAL